MSEIPVRESRRGLLQILHHTKKCTFMHTNQQTDRFWCVNADAQASFSCCVVFSLSDAQGGEGEGTGDRGAIYLHASSSRPVSVPEKPQNESACAAVPRCGSGGDVFKRCKAENQQSIFQSLSVHKSVDKSMIRRLRHRWDHVAGSGGIPGTAPAGWGTTQGNYSGQAGTDLQVNASNSRQSHNEALPSRGFCALSPRVTAGNGIF